MNAFEIEKIKKQIREETKAEFDEKIKKGEIAITDDLNSKSSFQNEVREIAQNARVIK